MSSGTFPSGGSSTISHMDKILSYGTRILNLTLDFQARIDKRAQEIRENKGFEQFTVQSIPEKDGNPKGPFPNST